jgi:hypothetical protein
MMIVKPNIISINMSEKILIGFCGAPSSGKDKIADALNLCLSNPCEKVNEEARRYIEEHGSIDNIFQQYLIMQKQLKREEDILSSYQVAISASPVFLAYFYAALFVDQNSSRSEISVLSDIYSSAIFSLKRYNYLFYCDPLINYESDGIRFQNNLQLESLSLSIKSFLMLHSKKFVILPSISIEERMEIIYDSIVKIG